MKILFLSSEVAPFSKTGGLADVAGALPAALAGLGHQVWVVSPLYSAVSRTGIKNLRKSVELKFPFGAETAHLHQAALTANHQVIFIENDHFFLRSGLYQQDGRDYADNARRFAFFSLAALSAAQTLEISPEIIHLNDWQCGLAAMALKRGYHATDLGSAKSVFTIHNLAYQGIFPKSVMSELGIPWDTFSAEAGLEFYDQVNFMKAGLTFSDALNTVSPTYASEIQTADAGCQLDGLLRQRQVILRGILNGVDPVEWNPSRKGTLPHSFSADDLKGKEFCKIELLKRMGMPLDPSTVEKPLFCVISRMADQKGWDLLLPAFPQVIQQGGNVIVLGSGERRYEYAVSEQLARYPERMAIFLGFDPALAHLVEAGSDFLLMPSRYEPCGLNQMYSLRYGTVPVVRATGGLEDTVVDLNLPQGNGIKFKDYTLNALMSGIDRAFDLYRHPTNLQQVRRRGMTQDFSWDRAAKQYESFYASLV